MPISKKKYILVPEENISELEQYMPSNFHNPYPPYYPYILGYSGISDRGNANKQKGVLYPPSCTIAKDYYVYHPWYALNGGAY